MSSESTPLYLRSAYPLWEPESESPNSGEKLLLTPYLNRGKVEEARKVARVGPGLFNEQIPSYSGYFTIDKNHNSNLFFWFFPSQVIINNFFTIVILVKYFIAEFPILVLKFCVVVFFWCFFFALLTLN